MFKEESSVCYRLARAAGDLNIRCDFLVEENMFIIIMGAKGGGAGEGTAVASFRVLWTFAISCNSPEIGRF
jgi:hypothetical protein